MEVNIKPKVRSINVHENKNTHSFQPKIKVQTKKIGKTTDFKTKSKSRTIPYTLETEDSNVIDWASPSNPFSREKKDKRPLVHLFISIAGALLVGTVMGFSVLTLFFSEHQNANHNSIDAHLPTPTPEKTPVADRKVSDKKHVVGKPIGISLPVLKVALLQAGNYQLKSSALKVSEQYRTKGFAAVMSDQAPFCIYLGVANNKTAAQQLTKRYAAKGITVYVKEQTFSGEGQKLDGLLETLKIGNQLFEQLQAISVNSITTTSKIAFPSNIKEQQLRFMKANQKSNVYPPETRDAMIELARGLDQAVQGAMELSKHQNSTLAWFIQEGLVRYATGYEHLLYSLSRNK
ncbi:hypothetical protein [Shimazuella kribbensis]|uniref:hypothetical protein n=1 Tax=Shimazuella kribbensis TaxID=139808 RepID=UPI00041FCB7C|nr:hypothetical protein [Shimazuella kribbensis]